jgi:hypothetical protein
MLPLRWGNRALRWYFSPEYLHMDRVDPRRPTLSVGNHSVFGVLDVLLFADGLYRERGISLRMLADRIHFKLPLWRDVVERTGAGFQFGNAAAGAQSPLTTTPVPSLEES